MVELVIENFLVVKIGKNKVLSGDVCNQLVGMSNTQHGDDSTREGEIIGWSGRTR